MTHDAPDKPTPSYGFPRRLRLVEKVTFDAVYKTGRRKRLGPIDVLALPNELGHPRLGLSVPRRVGSAVVRNRVKRLLRESFRHLQHDLPRGYDFVIGVRRHTALTLPEYQDLLLKAMRSLHMQWTSSDHNPTTP